MSEKINSRMYNQAFLPKVTDMFDVNCEYFSTKLYRSILNAQLKMSSLLSKKGPVLSLGSGDADYHPFIMFVRQRGRFCSRCRTPEQVNLICRGRTGVMPFASVNRCSFLLMYIR